VFASPQQLRQMDILDIQILLTKVQVVESARNHAVIFDNQLSLSTHVTALCRSGYFQLRQLRPVVRSLTTEVALASCLATSAVQSYMPGASVVVRLYLTDDINQTVAVAFSDQQLTGLASYHTPTIRTATRVSLLLVRVCGTICHQTYDETLATDNLSEH